MGDQPTEVDCAVYGQLVQMLITPDSILSKTFMKGMLLFTNHHKNITLLEVTPGLLIILRTRGKSGVGTKQ